MYTDKYMSILCTYSLSTTSWTGVPILYCRNISELFGRRITSTILQTLWTQKLFCTKDIYLIYEIVYFFFLDYNNINIFFGVFYKKF